MKSLKLVKVKILRYDIYLVVKKTLQICYKT